MSLERVAAASVVGSPGRSGSTRRVDPRAELQAAMERNAREAEELRAAAAKAAQEEEESAKARADAAAKAQAEAAAEIGRASCRERV